MHSHHSHHTHIIHITHHSTTTRHNLQLQKKSKLKSLQSSEGRLARQTGPFVDKNTSPLALRDWYCLHKCAKTRGMAFLGGRSGGSWIRARGSARLAFEPWKAFVQTSISAKMQMSIELHDTRSTKEQYSSPGNQHRHMSTLHMPKSHRAST